MNSKNKTLSWENIGEIVESLQDKFSELTQDRVENIRFTDLKKKILSLENFSEKEDSFNEKKLEAVQRLWLEELG